MYSACLSLVQFRCSAFECFFLSSFRYFRWFKVALFFTKLQNTFFETPCISSSVNLIPSSDLSAATSLTQSPVLLQLVCVVYTLLISSVLSRLRICQRYIRRLIWISTLHQNIFPSHSNVYL